MQRGLWAGAEIEYDPTKPVSGTRSEAIGKSSAIRPNVPPRRLNSRHWRGQGACWHSRPPCASSAADEFDPGMLLEAVRGPLRGAGLQSVRYRAPLEIDDNGPVSGVFAPVPVSIAMARNDLVLRCFRTWLFNLPQDGVVVDRHPQARQQRSLTRPSPAWPHSRTSSPTRCVFRADRGAIANVSANVF